MNVEQLKNASFDDIVFDGRNKQYGAYELRRKYSERLWKALGYTMIVAGLIFASFFMFGKQTKKKGKIGAEDVVLKEVEIPKDAPKKAAPPPPPPKANTPPPPPKVEMAQFSTPKIVEQPKQTMKSIDEIDKKENIGTKEQEGEKKKEDVKVEEHHDSGNNNIVDTDGDGVNDSDDLCPKVPISGKYYGTVGRGCPEKPADAVEKVVDVQAAFKGNWIQYLSNTIEYPEDAQENGIEGKVTVKYIVDLHGNISDVKAVSGPPELRKEAERAVRTSSGRWTPAQKGGQSVKAYGSQVVTFQLE